MGWKQSQGENEQQPGQSICNLGQLGGRQDAAATADLPFVFPTEGRTACLSAERAKARGEGGSGREPACHLLFCRT